MSREDQNKALMRRWYDEMWANLDFAKIPELAGPNYTRHDVRGTRVVTAQEYRDELLPVAQTHGIQNWRQRLGVESARSTPDDHRLFNSSVLGPQWNAAQVQDVEQVAVGQLVLEGEAQNVKVSQRDLVLER